MSTAIDGKQQVVIRYKDIYNQYKIGFMTIADIYKAYNDTFLTEFDMLDENMKWCKVSSLVRNETTVSGIEIITDHQTSITALSSQSIGCVMNPFKENQSFRFYNVGSVPVNSDSIGAKVQNLPLIYGKANNDTFLNEIDPRNSNRSTRLGYLDGVVLGGFLGMGGVCDGYGKVVMQYSAKYDAREHNFTESRKDQVVNAAREVLRLYDPYGLLSHKSETDNTAGTEIISFNSSRITHMIMHYIVSEAEAFGLNVKAKDYDNIQFYPLRNLWMCMAHSEIVNPNRYYANDPIIRNDVNNAVKGAMDHMPAAGHKYVDNETDNPLDDPVFNMVTISPNVLLESYDFRKGILKGLFDMGPLTLHTPLPTKGLVNMARLIAVSLGLNIYETRLEEFDHGPWEYYDIEIDWTKRPSHKVISKESSPISEFEGSKYTYNITLDDDHTSITLPNGMVIFNRD